MTRYFENSIKYGEVLARSIINESNNNLTYYSAAPYFDRIIDEKEAIYLEQPMKNGALGLIESDEFGISITIDSNIENKERKNFTLAHEIGHLLFHNNIPNKFESFLETNQTLDIDENLYNKIKETEANAFAAHLMLPNQVLKYQILSSMNAYHIKNISGISISALKWRIINFLREFYSINQTRATKIAEDFVSEYSNSSAANTGLYYIVKDDPSILPLPRFIY